MSWVVFHLILSFGIVWGVLVYIRNKCPIKFCTEPVWTWAFFGWETFDEFFYFFRFYRLFRWLIGLCLTLGSCIFLGIRPFPPDFPILWSISFCNRIWWFLEFPVSVFMSPLSFLIFLICILFLRPLVSLARGLSILLIFSKNQLLVLLIFSMVIFVSFGLFLP